MKRIGFNIMVTELIRLGEQGQSAMIGFYKANGEYTTKQVFWGAPKTSEVKEQRTTITKKGKKKRELRQGKMLLTDATTKKLLTPFSRLIVIFENKQVWH